MRRKGARCAPMFLPPSRAPSTPSEHVPSTLLRARPAAELLQHLPLAEIVLFNEHAEAALRPRFFICFPQTRKKTCRGGWGGGGVKGGEGGREREREIHTHAETHTGPEPCDWSGEVLDDMRGLGFFFFDPITGDVHRGGYDCSPVE